MIEKTNFELRKLTNLTKKAKGLITFNDQTYVDFSSNDYLGLASHPALKKAAREAIQTYGVGTGSSRLLSGNFELNIELEEELARFKNKKASLVFNSGYQANLGIITTLALNTDVIFVDRFIHRSIIDAILLAKVRFFRFHHNDLNHLTHLLQKERSKYQKALIITESVFSMDGDLAPLPDLVSLKNRFNCELFLDEAHATGIFGKNGAGLAEQFLVQDQIEYQMGTFSKALGSFGGFLACSKKVRENLIQKASSFIYSTSLPLSIIAANLASLKVIQNEPMRRKKLLQNAHFFMNELKKNDQSKGAFNGSQIIPFIVGSSQASLKLSKKLLDYGCFVLPIRPPTVPMSTARLRIAVNYYHTKKSLLGLVKLLKT
ncbi:MAG: 8-amino-7-oxononanoate synthase [Candidatus Margulisiibacteriota bacterium]|jgi:8-amino-7-oxononanoate synthase